MVRTSRTRALAVKENQKAKPAKVPPRSGDAPATAPAGSEAAIIAKNLADPGKFETVVMVRALSEARSIAALGLAIASNPEPVSPELARSLQAEENWWRKIENEYALLSSSDVAVLLGAKATNRNFASSQRAAGKLFGYNRRHAAVFPEFQFDVTRGTVLPVIPQLISRARRFKVSDEELMLWLTAPSSLFPKKDRPVDHLDDPERLLAAALDEFGASW